MEDADFWIWILPENVSGIKTRSLSVARAEAADRVGGLLIIAPAVSAARDDFASVVTIEVATGRRDQFLPLLAAHKARCLKDEPGTLQFEILLPKEDDTKVLSYEVYRDDAAFEVHRNGPSLAQWREETAGMVVRFHGTRCAVVD
jgi:(4S)-4-hydroxy-5-phosphonooxypentane-2,3-dione isomerase